MHLAFLAFRNLRARLLRTLLTTSGIIIGVGVILAIAITNESTLASVASVFNEASGRAQLVVNSASSSTATFEDAALARTSTVHGVVHAAPSLDVPTLLAAQADDWEIELSISGADTAGSVFHLYGVDPELDLQARVYKLTAGRWLQSRDRRAVVMVEDYAREQKLGLGQDLRVLGPDGEVAFEIVGLIARDGPGHINDGATGFAPLDIVQDMFDRAGELTQVDVVIEDRLAQDSTTLEQVRKQIETKLGSDFSVVYPAARGQVVTQLLSTYQQGLGFGSTIALFVGAFLIYNTFAMTVVERTREIGMLRALGMTRRQSVLLILQEAVLLGLAGSVLGIGLGVILARGLIGALTGVIGSQISEIVIPAAGVVTAVVVGLLVTLVAALLPARSAAGVSPIEALRVRAQSDDRSWLVRRGWMVGLVLVVLGLVNFYLVPYREAVVFIIGQLSIFTFLLGAVFVVPASLPFFQRLFEPVASALFGSEGGLGASNISRARGRTALTVGALTIGISMVIAQGALTVSFTQNLLDWVTNAIGADLYVRSPVGMREDLGRRLLSIDGVADVSPVSYVGVQLGERLRQPGRTENLVFIAIDPATYLRVANFQFANSTLDRAAALERLAAGDAVFVSTTMADKYGLQAGQTIPLVTPRGTREFQIAALIVDFTGQGYSVTGTRRDLDRYFGVRGVDNYLVSLTPAVHACATGSDCRDEAAVRHDIETRNAARHIKTESSSDFRDRVLSLANQAFALLNVLSLIGIIVAALGVINTLTMNVMERTREIGGLRALGLTMAQTARMILAEALLMGALGGLFGLGFGYILSQILVRGINLLGGYRVDYVFPPGAFLAGAIIALLVSELAALYPAWRAARTGIIQAIQHE